MTDHVCRAHRSAAAPCEPCGLHEDDDEACGRVVEAPEHEDDQ